MVTTTIPGSRGSLSGAAWMFIAWLPIRGLVRVTWYSETGWSSLIDCRISENKGLSAGNK